MTGPDEQKISAAPVKKSLLHSRATWIFTGSVLIVLVTGLAGTQALRGLNQRIVQLEQTQKTMTSQDEVVALRGTLVTQQQQLTALRARQTEYERQLVAIIRHADIPQQLQDQLKVQQTELNALKDSLEALKRPVASSPVVALPPAPSVILQKHQPTSARSRSANAVDRVVLKVPFILAGIEQRGNASFAAVAPLGFIDLSQVQLISEGESVAGWLLIRTGFNQATFRVNGRLQTVSVQ